MISLDMTSISEQAHAGPSRIRRLRKDFKLCLDPSLTIYSVTDRFLYSITIEIEGLSPEDECLWLIRWGCGKYIGPIKEYEGYHRYAVSDKFYFITNIDFAVDKS